jgi:hypothetical protein
MMMNLRTLVLTSGIVGFALAAVGGIIAGGEMALGIAVTTVVMLANLWGWSQVVGNAIGSAVEGRKPVMALGLYGLKCGLLGGSLLILLNIFSAMSVILGSSVVVGAVSTWAARRVLTSATLGDA